MSEVGRSKRQNIWYLCLLAARRAPSASAACQGHALDQRSPPEWRGAGVRAWSLPDRALSKGWTGAPTPSITQLKIAQRSASSCAVFDRLERNDGVEFDTRRKRLATPSDDTIAQATVAPKAPMILEYRLSGHQFVDPPLPRSRPRMPSSTSCSLPNGNFRLVSSTRVSWAGNVLTVRSGYGPALPQSNLRGCGRRCRRLRTGPGFGSAARSKSATAMKIALDAEPSLVSQAG
jgi:hypothetical protein